MPIALKIAVSILGIICTCFPDEGTQHVCDVLSILIADLFSAALIFLPWIIK